MRKVRIHSGVSSILILAITSLTGCHGLLSDSKSDPHQKTHINSLGNVGSAVYQDPKSERRLCVETAKSLVEGGHAQEAILLYEKAELLRPKEAKFDQELAALYASKGDYSKAIDRYRTALQKDSNPDLLNNYIWTLMEANQIAKALEAARAAQTQFANHESLQSTLGVVEYKSGNRESAFRIFEAMMGTSSAYHNLAVLDIDHGNAIEARRNLQLAISQTASPNPLSVQLLKQLDQYVSENRGGHQVASQPLQ